MSNKKIALYENIHGVSLKALLESRNISYTGMPIIDKLEKLINKEVDIMTAYLSHEPFVAKSMGIDTVTFDPKDYGFGGYGDILFTSKKILKMRPELVKKMYSVTKKGWEYAFDHQDELVDIIYDRYNTLNKSKKALKYEAEILKKISGIGNDFGEINADKVKSISHLYSFMVTKKYDRSVLDDFIYEYNNKLELTLTQEERDYLKRKETIRVCVQPQLIPIDGFVDNRHQGLVGDFYKLLASELDIKYEYIVPKRPQELDDLAKENNCDLVSIIATKQTRSPNIKPTNTLFKVSFAIITKINRSFIKNDAMLKDKRFLVSYDSVKAHILQFYPDMDIEVIRTTQEMKALVLNDQAYGIITFDFISDLLVDQIGYDNVKINGFLLPDDPLEASIGVIEDERILLDILNKSIARLSPKLITTYTNNWKLTRHIKEVDYSLVIEVVIIFLILSIFAVIWVLTIKKKNTILQQAKDEITVLNSTLEQRVKVEIEKNERQRLIMMQHSRLAQMGEMISMISHQWTQPLNVLSLLSQTIVLKYKIGKIDEQMIDDFKLNSQNQIIQMSNTIKDFRNFFKPEKEKVIFDITGPIDHALSILRPLLDVKSIQVNSSLEGSLFIEGFPNELEQSLINIINNAKDALLENDAEKEKIINISLTQKSSKVRLIIEDNGQGVPEEIIEKIFDPYFSTKTEKNGMGIGLYMTKLIIEEHMNGTINVENTKDGARFIIEFFIVEV